MYSRGIISITLILGLRFLTDCSVFELQVPTILILKNFLQLFFALTICFKLLSLEQVLEIEENWVYVINSNLLKALTFFRLSESYRI